MQCDFKHTTAENKWMIVLLFFVLDHVLMCLVEKSEILSVYSAVVEKSFSCSHVCM